MVLISRLVIPTYGESLCLFLPVYPILSFLPSNWINVTFLLTQMPWRQTRVGDFVTMQFEQITITYPQPAGSPGTSPKWRVSSSRRKKKLIELNLCWSLWWSIRKLWKGPTCSFKAWLNLRIWICWEEGNLIKWNFLALLRISIFIMITMKE